ncbi:WAT1-related protein [Panicum miliaceum]|uniref:WAT1-related protein n=1 Tax=Panicum miliaceum TaxID=4540 RepID=A0A3L6TFW4_PANMI|nr:WAT1-related protein [Panicum miliaceum]
MEVVNLRSSSGIAKVSGAALCLAGVLVMALYAGPELSPVSHHRAFTAHAPGSWRRPCEYIKGGVDRRHARILKEFPNRMLVAFSLCVFSALQSLVIAAVAERDFSRWKLRLDVSLVAITYNLIHDLLGGAWWTDKSMEQGFVVTGVSYYLQAWCVEMKGPVFCAAWLPLYSVFTMFCSSFLGEIVHLGSILGGILLIGGLYSVLWGKSKESEFASCSDMNTIDGAQDEQEHNKPDAD